MPKISTAELKISADNWIDDGDNPFNLYRDFEISGVMANDVVNVSISPNHQGCCVYCGLCPTCEIFDGKIRLRAKEIPTAEISAEFYVLKGTPNGKTKNFGNVNCLTSQRVIIYKVPEQVGTLTFNATPTFNYMFSDNSTDSKFFLWTIDKAA